MLLDCQIVLKFLRHHFCVFTRNKIKKNAKFNEEFKLLKLYSKNFEVHCFFGSWAYKNFDQVLSMNNENFCPVDFVW